VILLVNKYWGEPELLMNSPEFKELVPKQTAAVATASATLTTAASHEATEATNAIDAIDATDAAVAVASHCGRRSHRSCSTHHSRR
jgi:hypothetical protein